MAESVVLYEKHEPHTAIIRFNRPEKKNAINRDVYWGLENAWQEAKADDDVWTIILTGSGDAWCAGGDLKKTWRRQRAKLRVRDLAQGPIQTCTSLSSTNPLSRPSTALPWVVGSAWPSIAISVIACPQRSSVARRCVGLIWQHGPPTCVPYRPAGPFGSP